MDKFYKIPISMGQAHYDNSESYQSCAAIFWYSDFEDMMSEEAISQSLGFFESISNFFDNFDDDEDDTQAKFLLKRSRSTQLDSTQLGLLKEIGVQVYKNLPLCVILDIKIDLVQLHGSYLDVIDYVD